MQYYRHTPRMRNNYLFSMATMAARTRLCVPLYVHCLSCLLVNHIHTIHSLKFHGVPLEIRNFFMLLSGTLKMDWYTQFHHYVFTVCTASKYHQSPFHTLTVSESLFCKITKLERIWKLAAVSSQGMYLVGLPKTMQTPQDSPRSGRW